MVRRQCLGIFFLMPLYVVCPDYYCFFEGSMNYFVHRATDSIDLGLRVYRVLFVTCWRIILSTFQAMMKGTVLYTLDCTLPLSINSWPLLGERVDYYNFFGSTMSYFVNRAVGAIEVGLRVYGFLFSTCWNKLLDTFRQMMNGTLSDIVSDQTVLNSVWFRLLQLF